MTFDQIVADICGRLNLVSDEAIARVGQAVNRHYKRVTATVGLEPVRYVTRTAMTALDSDTVTFTGIEKIDRVFERLSDGTVTTLKPIMVAQMRQSREAQGDRYSYAIWKVSADSITILLPGLALAVTPLYADGWTTLSTMAGSDKPMLPESFHDILVFAVVAEEYLRKEKTDLADRFAKQADEQLRELRFHIADAPPIDWRQGNHVIDGDGGGGHGGSGSSVITGEIVFDRDPGPPFVVTPGSGKVENLDADKLDGQNSTDYHDAAQLTGALDPDVIADGSLPLAKLPNMPAKRLLGRSESGGGPPEVLQLGSNFDIENGRLEFTMKNIPPSRLAGRGSSSGAGDLEQITLGTNLSMNGTVLNATAALTPAGGADTQVQFNDGGAFGGDAGLTFVKDADLLNVAGALAIGANPATTGAIRLANGAGVYARNAANNGDIPLLQTDGNNAVMLGGGGVAYVLARNHIFPSPDATFDLGWSGGRFRDAFISSLNLGPSGTAASKLLGRGDGSAGAVQEITLGTNLSMSGTTLNATGGSGGGTPGGATTQIQFNDGGVFGGDAGLTYDKATDILGVAAAVKIGTNPASSGAIRLANGGAITSRNAANNGDIQTLSITGDEVNVGNGAVVTMPGPSAGLKIGNAPASVGTIRLTALGTLRARNGANSGDVYLIGTGGSDQVIVGNGAAVTMPGAGTLAIGTNPATTGAVRLANNAAIAARNAANNADHNILALNANDQVDVGGGRPILFTGRVYAGPGTFTLAAGVLTLDCRSGNYFDVNVGAAVTSIVFSNPPPPNFESVFTLYLNWTANVAVAGFPAAVTWDEGTAPTLPNTSGRTSVLGFSTINGGTRWRGYVGGRSFVT